LLFSINVLGQSQSEVSKRDSVLDSNCSRVINLSNDNPNGCLLIIDSLISDSNNADNIKFYECLKIYPYLVLGKHKEAYAQVKEIKEEDVLQETKVASFWYYYTLADFYATINNFSTALVNYNQALVQATTDSQVVNVTVSMISSMRSENLSYESIKKIDSLIRSDEELGFYDFHEMYYSEKINALFEINDYVTAKVTLDKWSNLLETEEIDKISEDNYLYMSDFLRYHFKSKEKYKPEIIERYLRDVEELTLKGNAYDLMDWYELKLDYFSYCRQADSVEVYQNIIANYKTGSEEKLIKDLADVDEMYVRKEKVENIIVVSSSLLFLLLVIFLVLLYMIKKSSSWLFLKNDYFRSFSKLMNRNYTVINDTQSAIKHMKKNGSKEEKQRINNLKRILNVESEELKFFLNLNKEEMHWLSTLKLSDAKLNEMDLKVSMLVLKNYSTLQIADFLNISIKSAESYRYRIRKKLGIKPEIDLQEFILNLVKTK